MREVEVSQVRKAARAIVANMFSGGDAKRWVPLEKDGGELGFGLGGQRVGSAGRRIAGGSGQRPTVQDGVRMEARSRWGQERGRKGLD